MLTIIMAVALAMNVLWTPLVVVFALLAESGGKESSFVVAGLTIWVLVEIGLTSWRVMRRKIEPRGDANLPIVLALVICLRPALDIVAGAFQPWHVSMAIASIVVVGACYLLRHHLATLVKSGASPRPDRTALVSRLPNGE